MKLTLVALLFIIAMVLGGLLTQPEIDRLKNTLTACRNTPANLGKERTKEGMAARKEARRIKEAWAEYLQGGPKPCPDGRECR